MSDPIVPLVPIATHSLAPFLLTPLLGREQELITLADLLQRPHVRLLTLTGAPGVGKTRLALQAATNAQARFADGVHFVSLASIRDPGLVMATIAQSLGLRQEGERAFETRLHEYCHAKDLLLVLDNCEQVTTAAPLLAELLTLCPGLKLLATSRASLHLRSEYEFPVLPLALPEPKTLSEVSLLQQNPAVALFVARAQAVKPDFQLTAKNCGDVAAICWRLDGLPLALELAAARSKLLPPAALLSRLESARLQVLSGGAQDYPARQQTLRDTLAWSYTLLDATQQNLFRRLAVFAGGCTLKAAETLGAWSDEAASDCFAAITALIDQNLLVVLTPPTAEANRDADSTTVPRITMLESIRDYALEHLRNAGEEEEARAHHAQVYLELAESAERSLVGPEQQHWLDRLEVEHDNLRGALRWSLSQTNDETAIRIASTLWRFWFARGYMGEGLRWLQAALSHSEASAPHLRAGAAGGAAILAAYLGHYREAARCAELSLTLCRQLASKPGISAALNGLAFISGMTGDHAKAQTLTNESVAVGRSLAEPSVLAQAFYYQGLTAWLAGEYAVAQAAIEEGLAFSHTVGDTHTWASFLYGQGLVTVAQHHYEAAQPFFEESMVMLRQLGDKRSITMCLAGLADIALSRQETGRARGLIQEALRLSNEVGDRWFTAYTVDGLAAAATVEGQVLDAARFFAAAEAMRTAIGAATPASRQSVRNAAMQQLQARLNQETLASAWAEGQQLTPEQILTGQFLTTSTPLSREAPSPIPASASTHPTHLTLTRREREVLRLVTQGLTDAQIAEKLVISPHTVHTHLSTIYSKLGVPSRTAAAHFAIQNQLV